MTNTKTTPTDETSKVSPVDWVDTFLWVLLIITLTLLIASFMASQQNKKPVVTTADNCVVNELENQEVMTTVVTVGGLTFDIPTLQTVISTSCGLYVIEDNVRLYEALKPDTSYELVIGDSRTLLDAVKR